jgi:hypothetical protein
MILEMNQVRKTSAVLAMKNTRSRMHPNFTMAHLLLIIHSSLFILKSYLFNIKFSNDLKKSYAYTASYRYVKRLFLGQ